MQDIPAILLIDVLGLIPAPESDRQPAKDQTDQGIDPLADEGIAEGSTGDIAHDTEKHTRADEHGRNKIDHLWGNIEIQDDRNQYQQHQGHGPKAQRPQLAATEDNGDGSYHADHLANHGADTVLNGAAAHEVHGPSLERDPSAAGEKGNDTGADGLVNSLEDSGL